jgi:hypothetical protein
MLSMQRVIEAARAKGYDEDHIKRIIAAVPKLRSMGAIRTAENGTKIQLTAQGRRMVGR